MKKEGWPPRALQAGQVQRGGSDGSVIYRHALVALCEAEGGQVGNVSVDA